MTPILARALALALAIVVTPSAFAVDLLPSETRLGETEARLLVRSTGGGVRVETEPPVLVAAAGVTLETAPREIRATKVWRGIDGVVEIVLQRDPGAGAVDILIEDDSQTGVWVEWPAAEKRVPLPVAALIVACLMAARLKR